MGNKLIRAATKHDRSDILSLAGSIGLFEPEEMDSVEELFSSWVAGNLGEQARWIVMEEDASIIGTAYFAPEPFADGTWNVYFIGVHPDSQRSGVGAALIHSIEETLTQERVRIVIVETSSLPHLEKARNFYLKIGYEQEARIREFYKAGEDKITFRKALIAL